jgi:predicted signal transduction protein with EAL and GGDEF domain
MRKKPHWPYVLSRGIAPAPKNAFSSEQTLELCDIYLDNADKTKDDGIALVLCHHAEIALSRIKNANKKVNDAEYQELRGKMADAYNRLSIRLKLLGFPDESEAFLKKAEKWR